jgi:hypothetical protein
VHSPGGRPRGQPVLVKRDLGNLAAADLGQITGTVKRNWNTVGQSVLAAKNSRKSAVG